MNERDDDEEGRMQSFDVSALARISIGHPLINILMPADARAAIDAIWNIDEECARSMTSASEATLRVIRLTWWRDQLAALPEGLTVSANPILSGLATHLPLDQRHQMAMLPDIWADFAEADIDDQIAANSFASKRGALLFRLTASMCGVNPAEVEQDLDRAGYQWAMADLANNMSDRALAASYWRAVTEQPKVNLPSSIKILAALSALGRLRARVGGAVRPAREQLLLLKIGLFG